MNGAMGKEYPGELGKAIGHAKRFAKVLAKLEAQAEGRPWITGRAAELRTVVSCAVQDWRSGARSEAGACESIVSYVEELHRGASRKLRCSHALDCCNRNDAVTAVGLDSVVSGVASGMHTTAPTAPAGWVDPPEVLTRFYEELPRVAILARFFRAQVRSRGDVVTRDDLEAFGRAGLLDAARSYNEGRGMPFRSWAAHRIRSAMLDGMRSWGPLPRGMHRQLRELEAAEWQERASGAQGVAASRRAQEAHAHLHLRLGSLASAMSPGDGRERVGALGEPSPSPEEQVVRAEESAHLREVVARLPERERVLVERVYFAGMTIEEAAAAEGMSKSWGSRLHAAAIERIGSELREAGVTFGATRPVEPN
jgi:RNA polymerase sigma factor for flagellar operon FliA